MARYVYPAVLTAEDDNTYSVYFPDIEGCCTCGDNLADALLMAEDALALMMYEYELKHTEIPVPSKESELKIGAKDIISLVACDTLIYRKRYSKKIIKKTLTIPEWLNEAAIDAGINFSQALQEILLSKLSL